MSPYEEFRRAIRDLGVLAEADIRVLWRSLDDARGAADDLMGMLPELVDVYGSAAQSLAADFYDEVRESAGARGRFSAIVRDPGDTGTSSLVRWALGEARDASSFQSLILGGLQTRIANQARAVVTSSSVADPAADGWMRTGSGGCDFCLMLISRGAVYSEATVDFAAHDACSCGVAPAFGPEQVRAVREEFVPSARRKSARTRANDNQRVADWIDANL